MISTSGTLPIFCAYFLNLSLSFFFSVRIAFSNKVLENKISALLFIIFDENLEKVCVGH